MTALVKVVFTKSRGLYPWLIRKVTRADFNHVYIQLPNGYCYEADMYKGVRFFHSSTVDINRLEQIISFKIPVDVTALGWLRYWLYQQNNKPYDWLGILGCLLGHPHLHNGGNKWYCSMLVADALAVAAVAEGWEGNITPHQLLTLCSNRFECDNHTFL